MAEPGAKSDSGLNIAMRLLLGIVAGLLISNMLKAAVKTTIGDTKSCCDAWPDALVSATALLFLGRLVVDNVLYYQEIEPLRHRRSYAARLMLIFMDLTSYALCYAVVALLDPDPRHARLPQRNVVLALGAMVLVEVLHFLWCLLALFAIKASNRAERGRRVLLQKWRNTSAYSSVMGFAALLATLAWLNRLELTTPTAVIFAFYALVSSLLYAVIMKSGYLRLRPK